MRAAATSLSQTTGEAQRVRVSVSPVSAAADVYLAGPPGAENNSLISHGPCVMRRTTTR